MFVSTFLPSREKVSAQLTDEGLRQPIRVAAQKGAARKVECAWESPASDPSGHLLPLG
jgi:hypothetical protein